MTPLSRDTGHCPFRPWPFVPWRKPQVSGERAARVPDGHSHCSWTPALSCPQEITPPNLPQLQVCVLFLLPLYSNMGAVAILRSWQRPASFQTGPSPPPASPGPQAWLDLVSACGSEGWVTGAVPTSVTHCYVFSDVSSEPPGLGLIGSHVPACTLPAGYNLEGEGPGRRRRAVWLRF